ncbi:hypothetical protein F5887DRAFT_917102 [Amanita rubescens]|nr:hypothetical protein F5887DRAFT_917102 [Amanita rubescens]
MSLSVDDWHIILTDENRYILHTLYGVTTTTREIGGCGATIAKKGKGTAAEIGGDAGRRLPKRERDSGHDGGQRGDDNDDKGGNDDDDERGGGVMTTMTKKERGNNDVAIATKNRSRTRKRALALWAWGATPCPRQGSLPVKGHSWHRHLQLGHDIYKFTEQQK